MIFSEAIFDPQDFVWVFHGPAIRPTFKFSRQDAITLRSYSASISRDSGTKFWVLKLQGFKPV
jgi:hypothetical protein